MKKYRIPKLEHFIELLYECFYISGILQSIWVGVSMTHILENMGLEVVQIIYLKKHLFTRYFDLINFISLREGANYLLKTVC